MESLEPHGCLLPGLRMRVILDSKVRIGYGRRRTCDRTSGSQGARGSARSVIRKADRLLPGREVLSTALKKTSGNSSYDAAVERAILAAQPLPVPTETDLCYKMFGELTLIFRPKD